MDDDIQIASMRAVANFLSNCIPVQRILNVAMADSQVNSAIVVTGLPWYSPEAECLKDMTIGGTLNEGRYGVHYCQLNKYPDGRNTGTAFIGWTNPVLANSCMAMFDGYQGARGTTITVRANETGNPYHRSNGRILGNPRCDAECWNFPDPRGDEAMSMQAQSWGAPTWKWNWREIIKS